MGYIFIGKQKVVLFSIYKKNDWESATGALRQPVEYWLPYLKQITIYVERVLTIC
jgi:hypothetical protein